MDETPQAGAPQPGTAPAARWNLTPAERRVLGVLIEKVLTTPEYYPLTLKALTAGCNQRNNRDPVTSLTEDQVTQALAGLRARHFVIAVKPDTGWATRWRHELDRLGIQGRDLAVLGELMLRGAQSEGELRTRASRMRDIADLDTLHEVLGRLREFNPPLVVRLSPEGASRGVRWTHAVGSEEELEADRSAPATFEPPRREPREADDALRARIEALERRIARLEASLGVGDEADDSGGSLAP